MARAPIARAAVAVALALGIAVGLGDPAFLFAEEPEVFRMVVPGTARKWRVAIPFLRYESEDPRAGVVSQKLADLLARDLAMSGFFHVLPRDKYLADPQKEDWKGPEIDFRTWTIQGAEYLVKGLIQDQAGSLVLEMRFFDVASAYMMLGRRYTDSFEKDRMMVHDFANRILETLTQEMGVFDTKIVYTAHKDPANRLRGEIHISDLDGTGAQGLTAAKFKCLFPDWSPNGRQIAYSSYGQGATEFHALEISVLDLVTRASTRLTRAGGMNTGAAWSPDGSQIAFAHGDDRSGGFDIYAMASNGTGIRKLTHRGGDDVSPSWSPDGAKIVFCSSRMGKPDIFVMNADGSEIKRLTTAGEQNTRPRWSPKGDRIAFSRMSGGVSRIWIMRPDGTSPMQLTNGPGSDEDPSWSPDGRMIAFGRSRGDDKRILVVPLTGDPITPITDGSGREQGPAWSPRFRY